MDKATVAESVLASTVHFKSKTVVIIDSQEVRKTDLHEALPVLLGEDFSRDYYFEYKTEKERKIFSSEVFSVLETKVKQRAKEKYSSDLIPESRPQVSYIPLVNINNNEKFLVNPLTKDISEICYDAWFSTLPKEDKLIVQQEARLAKFTYDPYDLNTLVMVQFENYELLKVNVYMQPKWRLTKNIDSNCPPEIKKVIDHVFPSEEARIYIYDWLYHTLVSRNEAYLVLNGAKGIGKGVFCSIVKALVGMDNYTEAPDSFLESQFNATLDKKRAIVLDEFRVDKPKHTKLKRYINKFQNIEKKGKDADRAVETFNNFIISNNDETDMYLEYDDRRFSCIDLTEKNLLDVLGETEISDLIKELEEVDSEMVRQFGYFIFNRGAKKYTEFMVFKGEKYHKLVQTSLKTWQKFLLEQILATHNEEIAVKNLANLAKAQDGRIFFPQNIQRIEDFLTNYRYGGEKRLGYVDRNEMGEPIIVIDEAFIADKQIEFDEDEDLL